MKRFFRVSRQELLLDGKRIGYRYHLVFFCGDSYIWDMAESVSSFLMRILLSEGLEVSDISPEPGFVRNGVFRTRMENGVEEIGSIPSLKEHLKVVMSRIGRCRLLKGSLNDMVQDLQYELRKQGISYWEDAYMCTWAPGWVCRYIGGWGAWDLVKAWSPNAFSEVVTKKINNAVNAVNGRINKKNYDLHWIIGDKASVSFIFGIKG